MTITHPPRRYLGIFLDSESRGLLLRAVKPRHPNVFAEHVTVLYGPSDAQVDEMRALLAGDPRLHLGAVYELHDEKRGQCLVLDDKRPTFPEHLRNRTLHITISTAEHTEPSYSKALLAASPPAGLVDVPTLRGDMRLCTSTQTIMRLEDSYILETK